MDNICRSHSSYKKIKNIKNKELKYISLKVVLKKEKRRKTHVHVNL